MRVAVMVHVLALLSLVGAAAPVPYSSDSCLSGIRGRATGFFHVEESAGRPVLVDPLGRGFFSLAVDRVQWCGERCEALGFSPYERHNEENYSDKSAWAEESLSRLKSWGFNTLGAGCDVGLLRRKGLVHAQFLGLGGSLIRGDEDHWICEYRQAPCTFFPNVFHPDFPRRCEEVAAKHCPQNRDDPWLLGYYVDNELAWWGRGALEDGLFDAVMAKPEGHSAKVALRKFLACRAVTRDIKREFLRLVAERYFSCTTAAIRKCDPNHLVLGCRFAGFSGADDIVWKVAGKYADLVTFNLYPWADIDRNVVFDQKGGRRVADLLSDRFALVGKPIIVTEWSFPAIDAGRPCLHGGGQRFRTQKEREQASELFARTLLSHPGVVGYGYFMWLDQPATGIRRSFPEDCNYGLVREDGSVYEGLAEMFRRVHAQASQIREGETPPERPQPERKGMTEYELFVNENRSVQGEVMFSRDGDAWRVDNGSGLVLIGRIGGRRMIEDIRVEERSLGSYGGMLKIVCGGSPFWIDAAKTVDVRFQPAKQDGVAVLVCTSEGAGRGTNFRLVHRFLISPRTADFVAQVVSAENTGLGTLEIASFYSRAFACSDDAVPEESTPNLWKAEPRTAWGYPDGRRLEMRSGDPSVRALRFWREGNGAQHPDAEFVDVSPIRLAKDGFVKPSLMMSVRISGQ